MRYPRSEHLLFRDNHADYGGAIYVADNTNAGACSLGDPTMNALSKH
jgi:predicted outer membrane repeat protein